MHGFVTIPFLRASREALDWLSDQIDPWLQGRLNPVRPINDPRQQEQEVYP